MDLEIKHKGKALYVKHVQHKGAYLLGTYNPDRSTGLFKVDIPKEHREALLKKIK